MSNLKQHIQFIHEGVGFTCNQCDFIGKFKDDLTRHIKVAHLQCHLCKFMFETAEKTEEAPKAVSTLLNESEGLRARLAKLQDVAKSPI